jgi:ATP-dependent Zn protease
MTGAPDELAAFHEAGHCVIRNYFSHEVAELWINEERGNCRFRLPDDRGDTVLFEDIAASLAGKIAEDRLCGIRTVDDWHASGDYKRAFDCAMRLNSGNEVGANLLLQWMSRRTELFVEKLWPSIQKLAYALLEREKLSGREIEQVLNGK